MYSSAAVGLPTDAIQTGQSVGASAGHSHGDAADDHLRTLELHQGSQVASKATEFAKDLVRLNCIVSNCTLTQYRLRMI